MDILYDNFYKYYKYLMISNYIFSSLNTQIMISLETNK